MYLIIFISGLFIYFWCFDKKNHGFYDFVHLKLLIINFNTIVSFNISINIINID